MRRFNRSRFNAAFMTLLTKSLLTVTTLLVVTGCRNTTNMPGAPLSTSSPLSPMQGNAILAPLQPVSGFGSTGASIRVPPPPTGAYSVPGSYGAPSTFGTPPTGAVIPSGLSPSGTTLGANGVTRGVTDLTPGIPVPMAGATSGVQQTGWVGQGGTNITPTAYGGVPAPQTLAPQTQPPPTTGPVLGPRSGGMQVIDLTGSVGPPGYVAPPSYPSSGMVPQSVPYLPPVQTAPSVPSNQFPVVQPSGSTFVSSSNSVPSTTSFGAMPTIQTASRPNGVALPSTEPFPAAPIPSAVNAGSDQLQWRRPSPQF